ncbi:MAG: RNA 2',3'-cyclic phosphodiesterase [Candidatus Hadarchaeales archaeon]
MRCFVAIQVDEEVRRKIVPLQERLSPLLVWKPVEFENMHVTLKFLGEIEDSKGGEVMTLLRSACTGFKSFELSFKGVGAFPSLEGMRVLWVGVEEGRESLVSLAKTIDSKLATLGFPREKDFVPHLTIGRVKSVIRKRELLSVMEGLRTEEFGKTKVESVELMRSTLTTRGPIYSSLGRVSLLGPA